LPQGDTGDQMSGADQTTSETERKEQIDAIFDLYPFP